MSKGVQTLAIIVYFSTAIALESHIPTYSGGVGVLAGDTLRACGIYGHIGRRLATWPSTDA
jgi:glucan phosphorylase